MSNIEVKNHQTDKNNFSKTALSLAGGAATGFAVNNGVKYLGKPYYNTCIENLDKFTPEEKEILSQEAQRMVSESGIKEKGFKGFVEIDLLKKDNSTFDYNNTKNHSILHDQKYKTNTSKPIKLSLREKLKQILEEEIKTIKEFKNGEKLSVNAAKNELESGMFKSLIYGSFGNKLKISLLAVTAPFKKISDILLGKWKKKDLNKSIANGCFDPLSNRIFSGKQGSLMHEVGHAINRNKNFLTKIPSNLGLISSFVLIPFVILNALFNKKPQKQSEQTDERSNFKKLRDFTHKHIGLTIAGLMLPTLAEEALASSRAIKFANASKIMSDNMKKQHKKSLKLAYGTYIFTTIITASTAKLVVSVKDKIIEHKSKKVKPEVV